MNICLIGNNGITDEGAKVLVAVLRLNETLQTLWLSTKLIS